MKSKDSRLKCSAGTFSGWLAVGEDQGGRALVAVYFANR